MRRSNQSAISAMTSANTPRRSTTRLCSAVGTLASWGLHRMGPGKTKLVDLPDLVHSFRRATDVLRKLEGLRIEAISLRDVNRTVDLIWPIIWDLKVGIGRTKIISAAKALHHLLPDVVPPIDREYTVQFFFKSKNAVQGDATKRGVHGDGPAHCGNRQNLHRTNRVPPKTAE